MECLLQFWAVSALPGLDFLVLFVEAITQLCGHFGHLLALSLQPQTASTLPIGANSDVGNSYGTFSTTRDVTIVPLFIQSN
jgi:hypothetical protein